MRNIRKITITDAELPIMKSLWAKGSATSPEIFAGLPGNVSTLKTLLLRLVRKGAVGLQEINQRNYRYSPLISEEEYIEIQRKSLLQRAFDGSAEKMLLNFVKEENISADDLKKLIDLIEKED